MSYLITWPRDSPLVHTWSRKLPPLVYPWREHTESSFWATASRTQVSTSNLSKYLPRISQLATATSSSIWPAESLSEPGHAGGAFPRPELYERLERVLERAKPDLIVACYGMNDGIYHPFTQASAKMTVRFDSPPNLS